MAILITRPKPIEPLSVVSCQVSCQFLCCMVCMFVYSFCVNEVGRCGVWVCLQQPAACRWTLLVLRECVFLSSIDVFLQVFLSTCDMVGEDLLCAPQEIIRKDFEKRSRQTRGFQPDTESVMDFMSVLPGSAIPRVDACEHNYARQLKTCGKEQPVEGRPFWDLRQNVLGSVRQSPLIGTLMPQGTIWSSTLQRPMVAEEFLLAQGNIMYRTDSEQQI